MNLLEFLEHTKRGVKLNKLKLGTKLVVETENSVYKIALLPDDFNNVLVSGGYFEKPTICRLTGSTLGGSAIKLGWIGIDMCMEFQVGKDRITTTLVSSVKIISDNFDYTLERESDEQS